MNISELNNKLETLSKYLLEIGKANITKSELYEAIATSELVTHGEHETMVISSWRPRPSCGKAYVTLRHNDRLLVDMVNSVKQSIGTES